MAVLIAGCSSNGTIGKTYLSPQNMKGTKAYKQSSLESTDFVIFKFMHYDGHQCVSTNNPVH